MARKRKPRKQVETLTHPEESRRNIPTSEMESLVSEQDKSRFESPTNAATATWTRSWCGVARTSRIGQTSLWQAPPLYIPGEGAPQGFDRRPAPREPGEGAGGRSRNF